MPLGAVVKRLGVKYEYTAAKLLYRAVSQPPGHNELQERSLKDLCEEEELAKFGAYV